MYTYRGYILLSLFFLSGREWSCGRTGNRLSRVSPLGLCTCMLHQVSRRAVGDRTRELPRLLDNISYSIHWYALQMKPFGYSLDLVLLPTKQMLTTK